MVNITSRAVLFTGLYVKKNVLYIFKFVKKAISVINLLVQSCGHIDESLLSTASQKLSGHVRKSGEQVE